MNSKITLLIGAILLAGSAFAQEANKVEYRRSSLYSIMTLDPNMPADAKKMVLESFVSTPVPDKYNDHNLDIRTLDVESIKITNDDVRALNAGGLGDAELKYAAKLQKYFNDNHVANQLISKWYCESPVQNNGSFFYYSLIQERGLYDASEEELAAAETSVRGTTQIMDAAAGELIPNTFVMVSRFSYVEAKEITKLVSGTVSAVGDVMSEMGGQVGAVGSIISGAANLFGAAAEATLKGYFVKTTTYLFQLEWDEEIQTEFETTYWAATDLTEFHKSDKYRLKYVGKTWDYAPATLTLSFNDEASGRMIKKGTVRAIDGSIKKLQKKYEVFKTLAPIVVDGETIYAYIGKKEGVDSKTKFEVLQLEIDKKTGKSVYNRVGTVKAKKGKIWDNRYGAGEVIPNSAQDKDDDKDSNANLQYTEFKGSAKKFISGMFLRQVK